MLGSACIVIMNDASSLEFLNLGKKDRAHQSAETVGWRSGFQCGRPETRGRRQSWCVRQTGGNKGASQTGETALLFRNVSLLLYTPHSANIFIFLGQFFVWTYWNTFYV